MYEDSVRRVLKLMKDTFENGPFKEFYDGDPEEIPEFNLPCLVVSMVSDNTQAGSFGQDDVTETLVIKVIMNKKDDWSNETDPLNMTERKIRELVGLRDPATGNYEDRTVKGALRKFGTQGITSIGLSVDTEYGITPRANDIITAEGHVTFTYQYAVDVDVAV